MIRNMHAFSFSPREVKEILMAVAVLAFVFSYPEVMKNTELLLFSLLSVGIAFLGHELSHKFAAQRYGYFAEFRLWPFGLLLAVAFAVVLGIVFAAPGAVVFGSLGFRRPRKREIGRIAAAGPIFNILAIPIFLALHAFTGLGILRYAAGINAWLAIFNMIPIAPLDGEKVWRWDKRMWGLMLLLAIGGFVLSGVLR